MLFLDRTENSESGRLDVSSDCSVRSRVGGDCAGRSPTGPFPAPPPGLWFPLSSRGFLAGPGRVPISRTSLHAPLMAGSRARAAGRGPGGRRRAALRRAAG